MDFLVPAAHPSGTRLGLAILAAIRVAAHVRDEGTARFLLFRYRLSEALGAGGEAIGRAGLRLVRTDMQMAPRLAGVWMLWLSIQCCARQCV